MHVFLGVSNYPEDTNTWISHVSLQIYCMLLWIHQLQQIIHMWNLGDFFLWVFHDFLNSPFICIYNVGKHSWKLCRNLLRNHINAIWFLLCNCPWLFRLFAEIKQISHRKSNVWNTWKSQRENHTESMCLSCVIFPMVLIMLLLCEKNNLENRQKALGNHMEKKMVVLIQ